MLKVTYCKLPLHGNLSVTVTATFRYTATNYKLRATATYCNYVLRQLTVTRHGNLLQVTCRGNLLQVIRATATYRKSYVPRQLTASHTCLGNLLRVTCHGNLLRVIRATATYCYAPRQLTASYELYGNFLQVIIIII